MIDQFKHADKQFRATHDRLRDMSACRDYGDSPPR
jgi:hypothetical protein